MYIALQFTYHVDVIALPISDEGEAKKIQTAFDKWLYDKTNDHGHWIIIKGEKVAVSFDTDDFIHYVNEHHLADSEKKAHIVERELEDVPDTCVATLFF